MCLVFEIKCNKFVLCGSWNFVSASCVCLGYLYCKCLYIDFLVIDLWIRNFYVFLYIKSSGWGSFVYGSGLCLSRNVFYWVFEQVLEYSFAIYCSHVKYTIYLLHPPCSRGIGVMSLLGLFYQKKGGCHYWEKVD
jgi:hypothetical protein